MPQRYYIDKENLNEEFDRIDKFPYELENFAIIHEDMTNTIENLMSIYSKDKLQAYEDYVNEYEELPSEDKEYYEDADDYIWQNIGSRWWVDSYYDLSDVEKEEFLIRYRNTIACCVYSDTYNQDTIWEEIESC